MNVQRQVGHNINNHECPKEITNYQDNMDAVDRGDWVCLEGGGFCSKSHCKKWCKRGHFGVVDFGLFNSNVAWNLSCPKLVVSGKKICMPLLKWQFTAIVLEELIVFDLDEDNKILTNHNSASILITRRNEGHFPTMDLRNIYRHDFRGTNCPCLSCAVCDVEETCMQTLGMKPRSMFSQGMKGWDITRRVA
eukprot:11122274-Ditylum_brightwellii.AAC.1